MSDEMLGTQEEVLDFSGDGVKPEEKTWAITRAEVKTDENEPQNKQLEIDLVAEGDDTPFPRTERYWLSHVEEAGKDWAKAVEIARGNAKRFAIAATGTPQINPTKLVGMRIVATIGEDKGGFVKLSRFKSAPAAESIA